jgi:DNA-binding CsgD family transcriptional regulator
MRARFAGRIGIRTAVRLDPDPEPDPWTGQQPRSGLVCHRRCSPTDPLPGQPRAVPHRDVGGRPPRTAGPRRAAADRVLDVSEFLGAIARVAHGGSALDPQVVAALLNRNVSQQSVGQLTERENEVLRLMAQGMTNTGIAKCLVLSERTVEAHVRRVLHKLGIPDSEDANRRVLAVLIHLGVRRTPPSGPIPRASDTARRTARRTATVVRQDHEARTRTARPARILGPARNITRPRRWQPRTPSVTAGPARTPTPDSCPARGRGRRRRAAGRQRHQDREPWVTGGEHRQLACTGLGRREA